jgi:ABC-type multidrug transport system fused ATPase/permease subunit
MFITEINRLLSAHNRRWRRSIAVAFAIAVVQAVAVVMRPLPIKALIEPPAANTTLWRLEQVAAGLFDRLWLYVAIIAALEIAIFASRVGTEYVIANMSERVIRSIRGAIVRNLLQGPYRTVSAAGPGAVLAAASDDVASVQRLMREALVASGVALGQLVLMLVVIFFVQEWLFFVLLFEIAFLAGGIALYANWRKKRYLVKMEHEQHLLGYLSTVYQKNLDVRFTALRSMFMVRTTALVRRLFGLNLTLWMRHGTYSAGMELVIGASAAMCLVLLLITAGDGPPPIGTFLVFAYYTMLIFPCLSQIGEAWPMINDARAALKRINANTEPAAPRELPAPETIQPPPARFGRIELKDVVLTGPRGEIILDGITFTIEPGEKIGLFGDSGSGKTSILSLLLGLQVASSGLVTIDGRDVRTLTLADRKRLFFFMRATTAFLPGTVYDNIALTHAPSAAKFAEVTEHARIANRLAAEATGAAVHVSDKGEPFSGGEQQRIAIARAFLADQPCIILDEALNSLDEPGEYAITERLVTDLSDKTMIVVSHRRGIAKLFPHRIEFVRGGQTTMIRP